MTKFTAGTTDALVEELATERNLAWNKGYAQGRDDAHQTIVELQTKVDKLTAIAEREVILRKKLIAKVEELRSANNAAYNRGWLDALDEEYQRAGWKVSDE